MIAIFFIFAFAINSILATNYCDRSLCMYEKEHIACNNDGRLSRQCPKSAKVIDLSSFKDLIVDTHNSYRNKIATGNLKPYNSAVRMASMTWDDELAKMATLNVKRCKFEHDGCRNTQVFKTSGQNLYTSMSSPDQGEKAAIVDAMDRWYDEYKIANANVLKKFHRTGRKIGHFTVMVAESNYKVGCGAVKLTENYFTRYLIACNYATTNIIDRPIYESGPTASKCKTGKHPKYPGLCSPKEKY